MQKMTSVKFLGAIGLLLLTGSGTVFAQNQVVNGTLTVSKGVTLNSASGNTAIDGNVTLGSSSFNTITYNGVAVTNLDMGENQILNLQGFAVGEPSGVSSPLTPFTGAITLYNSAGTGSAKIVAANTGSSNFTYTIPNGGASGTFMMTSGAQTVTGAKSFTIPIAATSGGTGTNTYAVGDLLVANSTTTLARLPAGTAGQVLGISSSGGVSYITNGATVTNSVVTQTVPATEDLNVSNAAGYIRLTNTTGTTLNVTGVQVGSTFTNGSVITLVNVSSDPSDVIQITNLDGASTSSDQFDLPGNQPVLLTQKGAASFIYDGTLSKWELVSTN